MFHVVYTLPQKSFEKVLYRAVLNALKSCFEFCEVECLRVAIHHCEGILGLILIIHLTKQCKGIRSLMISPAIKHNLDYRACNQNVQSTSHYAISQDPKNEFANMKYRLLIILT